MNILGISAFYHDSASCDVEIRAVLGQNTNISETPSTIPLRFGLLPTYPNPFNMSCVVPFALDRREHIQLMAYGILGQRVAVLMDGIQDAAVH